MKTSPSDGQCWLSRLQKLPRCVISKSGHRAGPARPRSEQCRHGPARHGPMGHESYSCRAGQARVPENQKKHGPVYFRVWPDRHGPMRPSMPIMAQIYCFGTILPVLAYFVPKNSEKITIKLEKERKLCQIDTAMHIRSILAMYNTIMCSCFRARPCRAVPG